MFAEMAAVLELKLYPAALLIASIILVSPVHILQTAKAIIARKAWLQEHRKYAVIKHAVIAI